MIYVSIDIETTGLNCYKDQILEIGAIKQVFGGKPVDYFRRVIKWDRLVGSPFALQMNVDLIREGMKTGININQALDEFSRWLVPENAGEPELGDRRAAIIPAGKNFASFDKQFFEQHKPFKTFKHFKHRTLDPTSLYLTHEDEEPLDLASCLERAGFDNKVTHRAVEDAWLVIQLIEKAYGNTLEWSEFHRLQERLGPR